MIQATAQDQTSDITSFLKGLRYRIDPATHTLGEYERLRSKRGLAVSQEELAEAVGVSRNWYAMLERGADIQPSIQLLTRLADALNTSADERITLFRLAIPALRSVTSGGTDAFEGLSLLRVTSNRLRSADSDDDALAIAAECASHWFDDAALVVSAKRIESEPWEWYVALNRDATPVESVATPLSNLPYLQERISGPGAFHGFIHVRHAARHAYSQFDREVLAAIADLASLALS